jgi:hypothetical protein
MANETAGASRGWFLTMMAVLFVVLAISDFTKALQFLGNPSVGGVVILGHKFHGVLHNVILGPLVGIVLLAYAFGIWRLRPWVLPLSIAYAFYVPFNLVLFWSLHQLPPPTVRFIVFYLVIALGGSIGTAIYLTYNRAQLT